MPKYFCDNSQNHCYFQEVGGKLVYKLCPAISPCYYFGGKLFYRFCPSIHLCLCRRSFGYLVAITNASQRSCILHCFIILRAHSYSISIVCKKSRELDQLSRRSDGFVRFCNHFLLRPSFLPALFIRQKSARGQGVSSRLSNQEKILIFLLYIFFHILLYSKCFDVEFLSQPCFVNMKIENISKA